MHAVVVGAGPVGLYTAVLLARAGHDVTVVDRDAGPAADGTWERKGVMQFWHPHLFRSKVHDAFAETAPDLWDAVVAAGGVPATPPGAPPFVINLQCRRWVFEQALRGVAAAEPRVTLRTGHADGVASDGGHASGVIVDGALVEADLIIDASGRSGRLGDDLRAPGEGGACGLAYVSRMYRARPELGDLPPTGIPDNRVFDGYFGILFPQDANTVSTLIVRPDTDRELAGLRHPEAYEAALRAIPHFAEIGDPDRFEPITDVMPGGGLTNTYRGQLDENGNAALPGMFWVGDAMLTTNPAAGRGVTLGLQQAKALVAMLAEDATDPASTAQRFQSWCDEHMKPWFHDHVLWDESVLRRFAGEDIDVEGPISSDVICAAAEVDPTITEIAAPFLGMMVPPTVLRAVAEERARAVLRTGGRPEYAAGPTRDDLVELIRGELAQLPA